MKYNIVINGDVSDHNLTFSEAIKVLREKYPNNKVWRVIPDEPFEIESDIIIIE